MEFLKGRYKGTSRIPKDQIRRTQKKHAKDILQPRHSDGEVNIDYVKNYGAKGITVSRRDIRKASKKFVGGKVVQAMVEAHKRQIKEKGMDL